jgi:molecular chaperone GrpE
MTGKSKQEEAPKETEEEQTVDPLAEAQAKADEYLDMARRVQADFDNYRKRSEKEKQDYKAFATADLLSDLLTIVDDLDRALEHNKDDNDFVTGVKGVRKNLMKVLESKGLKEIDTSGKFDPNYHEAFASVEADTDGDIAEVFQKGYCIGTRVLRTAKVKITKKSN